MNKVSLLITALLLLPSYVFAAPVTFICDYSHYSDDKGKHKPGEEFVLRFIDDIESNKAYLLDNQGSEACNLIV